MINKSKDSYGYKYYTHTCPQSEDEVDSIYNQYNIWGKHYDGWHLVKDNGRDYPDEMVIAFCPWCGEKLPEPDLDIKA